MSNIRNSVASFEATARQTAERCGCRIGMLQMPHFDLDDLTDDEASTVSIINGKAADGLKLRLLNRLAALMCGETGCYAPSIAMMKEDICQQAVDIWFIRMETGFRQVTASFLSKVSEVKELLRIHDPGAIHLAEQKQNRLWVIVLECFLSRTQRYVEDIRNTFDDHKGLFDDLVTTLLGVCDEAKSPSVLDQEVGDLLLRLRSQVCALPKGLLGWESQQDLVNQASNICRLPHLEERLKYILGKSDLSQKLLLHIRAMTKPKRTFDTLVRASRVLPTFAMINFHFELPTVEKFESRNPRNMSLVKGTKLPAKEEKSRRIQAYEAAEVSVQEPKEDFFSVARQFLPAAHQHLGIRQLEPVEKRQTFLLLAALLHRHNPNPEWDSYYVFGYATCRSEDEAQSLGGIYLALLKDCGEKTTMFNKLWKALENNAIVDLIDANGYEGFRKTIPNLETFLQSPPHKRETVWQLIQFVRVKGNTDPSQVLVRDYGFHRCTMRDQVTTLKEIYENLLHKIHPLELHQACIEGNLRAVADFAGISLEQKHMRLLENQYPMPGLGYEMAKGAFGPKEGWFRNRLKK